MKSVADKLTAAQLMSYVLKAMLEYKDMRKKKPLPMIYPLILYHGDTKFKYALDFLDLVDGSKEEIDKYLRGNLQLIDLNTTTDEELMDKSEVLMSLPLLCLKHIKDKNMLDFLTRNKKHAKRLLSLFRQYIETVGMENMTSILHYVYTAGKIDNEDEFVKFLNDIKPKLEKNMMTLREAAVQEGREEGIEQGMERGMERGIERGMERGEIQVIQKMLTNGTPEIVAKLLGWPVEKVKQIATSLIETV